MFNKNKIEELQEKIEYLEERVEEVSKKNKELQGCVDVYKNLYREAVEEIGKIEKEKPKKVLEKYDYAILFKRYHNEKNLIFYNEGRYEPNVKELHIDLYTDETPTIKIIK